MLNQAVQDAINEQIKHEFYSAYLYLSMSSYCMAANLPGFASWLELQAREELGHAMKFLRYVQDRGGHVALKPVDAPPGEFNSPLEVFRQALQHERDVTGMIHGLYRLARQENDHATEVMLQWFISEQVEEEKSAGQIVAELEVVGDDAVALLMLDRQLAQRSAAG